ncbi:hypothetical protein SDC9_167392 [bioreactor metagenome]|uniref:Uncharacterized protein n=1 Tax=bioreactor metagenome TaxID=1076179 RepID=A0A645G1H7_9ZZZZ
MHGALLDVLALAALSYNFLTFGNSSSHFSLPSLLLLIRHGALGSLAGAGVGLAALAADGQALAVAHPPIAADLGQALDVHRHVAAQVAFHNIAVGDGLAELCLVVLGQVLHAGIGIDPGFCKDLVGAGAPNAENVGESDLHPLILRQVNAGNTCHIS